MAYHPWNDAGERYGDWIIRRTDLGGLQEVMCWKRRVILLENDRTKWERRCDLTHAIAHIDLAHRRLDDKSEAAAVRYAAKMLIDLEPLSAALSMSEGQITPDAADALGVDEQTLMARLQHLHPGERGYLMRELAHLYAEHVA